jgi:hypothetical protein
MASKHDSRFDKIQEALGQQDYSFMNQVINPKWYPDDIPTSAKEYEVMLRDAVSWAVEFPGRKIMAIHMRIINHTGQGKAEMDAAQLAVENRICREFDIPDLKKFMEGQR